MTTITDGREALAVSATVKARAGASPAGPGHPIPLHLDLTTPPDRRRQPVVLLAWRVMVPGGGTLGFVSLTYARANGRFTWNAYAPGGRWVQIVSPGRPRRGRDALAALLRHHGVQEVR
jgi:hypothetical protein